MSEQTAGPGGKEFILMIALTASPGGKELILMSALTAG